MIWGGFGVGSYTVPCFFHDIYVLCYSANITQKGKVGWHLIALVIAQHFPPYIELWCAFFDTTS